MQLAAPILPSEPEVVYVLKRELEALRSLVAPTRDLVERIKETKFLPPDEVAAVIHALIRIPG